MSLCCPAWTTTSLNCFNVALPFANSLNACPICGVKFLPYLLTKLSADSGSTLTALTNKELKLPYNDLVYDSMEMNLKPVVESTEGWRFKCAVLGDCGFEDYLRGNDIGEDL